MLKEGSDIFFDTLAFLKTRVLTRAQRIFSGYFLPCGLFWFCKIIFRDPPKIPFKTNMKLTFRRLFLSRKVILPCNAKPKNNPKRFLGRVSVVKNARLRPSKMATAIRPLENGRATKSAPIIFVPFCQFYRRGIGVGVKGVTGRDAIIAQ